MEEIKAILFEEERKEEDGRLKILKRNMLIYVKYIYKVIFCNDMELLCELMNKVSLFVSLIEARFEFSPS